jgi:hypothetical protein
MAEATARGVPEGGADTDGLLREPAEELGCVPDFGRCIAVGLAVLQHDQAGERVGVLPHEPECVVQDLRAAPGWYRTPVGRALMGRLDRGTGIVRTRRGHLAEEAAGGGVVHRVGPSVGGREPAAADEQIAVGERGLGEGVDADEVHELLFSRFGQGRVRCAVNLRARHTADKVTPGDRNGGCCQGNSMIMGEAAGWHPCRGTGRSKGGVSGVPRAWRGALDRTGLWE